MKAVRRLILVPALSTLLMVAPAAAAEKAVAPVNETVTTKDGVQLHLTFYGGGKSKNTAPVVLLHDLKETRHTYSALAKRLANPSREDGDEHSPFAVVTVDLRGHGESVTQTYGGRERNLSAGKLRSSDYAAMVLQDMEAVRGYLVEKNDAGELNLNQTSIIGVGLGAVVAMNYCAYDWAMKDLPNIKQGRDIKSLVLVSPRWKLNGLSVLRALKQPGLREEVAVLMMYGSEDRRVNADCERIYKQLSLGRDMTEEPGKLNDLTKISIPTELQGANWLKQAGDKGSQFMIRFVNEFSVKPAFPWSQRKQY